MKSVVCISVFITISHCVFSQQAETKIGTQVWATKNLNVDYFRNGDPIPQAKTDEEWKHAGENKQPAWCYYYNYSTNGTTHGKLYNWYAVNDSRGLAPKGWHVPSDNEWRRLTNYIGDNDGKKLKATSGWSENGNGTDVYGFAGLPGGYRVADGTFYDFGKFGGWWSSSQDTSEKARLRYLFYRNADESSIYVDIKSAGYSVRCVRD